MCGKMKHLCSQLFANVESVGGVVVRLVETGSSKSVTALEKLLFSSCVGGGWDLPREWCIRSPQTTEGEGEK